MKTKQIQTAKRIEAVDEYYFSTKLAEIRKMNTNGDAVINLGIGNPDLAPSENIVQELMQAALLTANHGYQSYTGIPELRTAFSDWYRKYYQVDLNPENEILPLFGSKEGIMHISLAFLNSGDEVLIPDPGYPAYSSAATICEAKSRIYNLTEENNWCPDLEEIEKSDLTNVKLMWVNYPNMPTGKPASMKLFERLIAFGRKHGILIVNDNPYSLISTNNPLSLLSVKNAKKVAIELNSLSKSHNMAGWRVGMIGGAAEYIQAILKVKSNMDSGMFKPIQMAAAEALRNTSEWYENQRNIYSERKKIAQEILDSLLCDYNTEASGMFVWAKIPKQALSSESFSEDILQNKKVFITPGFIFGKNGERFIRLSLTSNETVLREALNRIKSE
ncbi:MAG TPA: aminotransferase [Bacteroidales bacterium]|nr:aminotransferase [Bacteroidales bacterium]